MRRRSIKPSYAILGVTVIALTIGSFFGFLLPMQKRLVDAAGLLIAGGSGLTSDGTERTESNYGALVLFGRHADEFQDMLFINQALPVGTKVIDGDALIGFVVEAGVSMSKVRLITSPEAQVQAVFEESGIPVQLVGKGAGILQAELPKGSSLRIGERVYVADDPALSIGTIARIRDVASDPFLKITVLHNINLTTLSRVGIL